MEEPLWRGLINEFRALLYGTCSRYHCRVRRSSVHDALSRARARLFSSPFDSAAYWERRYARHGTSGAGSYGRLASFKADVINTFLQDNAVVEALELGCGDGNQLGLINYPRYTGVDVSKSAIETCRSRFAADNSKEFLVLGDGETLTKYDLTVSLDVVYHLVEDSVYLRHLQLLFEHADRFVIVYTSDSDRYKPLSAPPSHIRHRPVCRDISSRYPDWVLSGIFTNPFPLADDESNESFAEFFTFARQANNRASST